MDIAISINNISKSFRMYPSPKERLKELLHPFGKKYHRDFWALKDLSFEVNKGETIGIIGRNGSGKSTLLQLICGILQPTQGEIKVNGRIAALLELGSGFNAEFTGRQNVYMNGAMMGFRKEEMDEKFQAVVDFADIGDFIDQPVKTYSSGMYVRLAFAVAIHVEPAVLIVDEALAVGDAAFQVKCMERIIEMRKRGVTILLVTHDATAVKRFCDRACWIHEGKMMQQGDPIDVPDRYMDFLRAQSETVHNAAASEKEIVTGQTGELPKFLSIEMLNSEGNVTDRFECGERVRIRVRYSVSDATKDRLIIGIAIFRNDDLYVCGLNTGLDDFEVENSAGDHGLILEYPSLNLLAGAYHLRAGIFHSSSMVAYDFKSFVLDFFVTAPYRAEGLVLLEHAWKTE
jgi:teichoic acid transport system ATP-binding protein